MNTHRLAIVCVAATSLLAGCGSGGGSSSSEGPVIGYSVRSLEDPFQAIQATVVADEAKSAGVDLLPVIDAGGDGAKQNQDVSTLLQRGIKGLLINPIDPAAIVPAIEKANSQGVPVVTLDTAASSGEVAMNVSVDNIDAAAKACEVVGSDLSGRGTVLNLEGAMDNNVGVARSKGFTDCIAENYPDIDVISKSMNWQPAECARVAQTVLSTTKIDGIYSAASIVCTDQVTSVLKKLDMYAPVGSPGHIVHVSLDGSPSGVDAVRSGALDALMSFPMNETATVALYWLQRAMDGEPIKEGPTEHDSEVTNIDGQLFDQLPSTVVTKDNADDPDLWGNQIGN